MGKVAEQRAEVFTKPERESMARKLTNNQRALLDYTGRNDLEYANYPRGVISFHSRPFGGLQNFGFRFDTHNDKSDNVFITAEALLGSGLLEKVDVETPSSRAPFGGGIFKITDSGRLVLGAWHAIEQERVQALAEEHRNKD